MSVQRVQNELLVADWTLSMLALVLFNTVLVKESMKNCLCCGALIQFEAIITGFGAFCDTQCEAEYHDAKVFVELQGGLVENPS